MRWSSESAGTAVERRLVLGFGVLQKPSLSPYWRRCGVPVSVTNSARQATNHRRDAARSRARCSRHPVVDHDIAHAAEHESGEEPAPGAQGRSWRGGGGEVVLMKAPSA